MMAGEEKVIQWYVRWEGTNEISGPMSKQEALDATGDGSGMAFSEGVFEPYHVPADTTLLVNELLAIKRVTMLDLCKRAADMLVILSRPREVAGVSGVVTSLLSASSDADKVAGFVELSPNEAKDIANDLTLLARPREVMATVRGGVFEVETIAQGVHLVVRDYDVEGSTQAADFDHDDDGNECIISEHGP